MTMELRRIGGFHFSVVDIELQLWSNLPYRFAEFVSPFWGIVITK